jgi:hypothetical protein
MRTTKRRVRTGGDEVMTSVRLPRALLDRARIHGIRHRTTLRDLIEEGLRLVLARKEET